MNGLRKVGAVRLSSGYVVAGLLPLFAGMLVLPGCGPDNRIEFDKFLEMRAETLRPAEPELTPPTPAQIDESLSPYRAGPSDVLGITVVGSESNTIIALNARVDRKGQIELPIVGNVNVGGLELEDIEDAIHQAVVPSFATRAVVNVDALHTEKVNVLVTGAVPMPGLVALQRNQCNMLFAIAAAGGITQDASGLATVKRIRRPDDRVTFDVTDPVQLGNALTLDKLDDGDIVFVHPAPPNTVFVGGLVNRPAPQAYDPGAEVTILQALAAASGLRTDVFPREGTLIRRMPDGSDVHVKLDLHAISKGKQQNITLAAGDILWVPDTWATRTVDFVNRNFFVRAGATITYSVSGVEYMNRRAQQSLRSSGGSLEDSFDPFGFLTRNATLSSLTPTVP